MSDGQLLRPDQVRVGESEVTVLQTLRLTVLLVEILLLSGPLVQLQGTVL